jgi:uncharacterized metal-binding protein
VCPNTYWRGIRGRGRQHHTPLIVGAFHVTAVIALIAVTAVITVTAVTAVAAVTAVQQYSSDSSTAVQQHSSTAAHQYTGESVMSFLQGIRNHP